jgi:Domain of unknown function (DUF4349)
MGTSPRVEDESRDSLPLTQQVARTNLTLSHGLIAYACFESGTFTMPTGACRQLSLPLTSKAQAARLRTRSHSCTHKLWHPRIAGQEVPKAAYTRRMGNLTPIRLACLSFARVSAIITALCFAVGCGSSAASRTASVAQAPQPAKEMTEAGSYGYEFSSDGAAEADTQGFGVSTVEGGNPVASPAPPARSPSPREAIGSAVENGIDAPAEVGHQALLIYDATLVLAVFEVSKAMERIEVLTRENAGYLVTRNQEVIKVRVPAQHFDKVLASLAGLGDELARTVEVRDVTEEYADVQARLHALQVVRERLETLLSRADKTEDALAVERELQRVTSEMESLQGRMKVLTELVRFSTISVRFQARATDSVSKDIHLPFPWLQQLGLPNLLQL